MKCVDTMLPILKAPVYVGQEVFITELPTEELNR